MAISVTAWNIQEGLAERDSMPAIIETLKWLDSDVVVLSDAHSVDNPLHGAREEVLEAAREQLALQGYDRHEASYDDGWHHSRHIVTLSRLGFARKRIARLATRNAVEFAVQDPNTSQYILFLGAHFRDDSEALRMHQASEGATRLLGGPEKRGVLLGDLNSAGNSSPVTRLLASRPAHAALSCIPHSRARSQAQRASKAARGETIKYLERRGLTDADDRRTPTFPAARPFLQLDHIMTTPWVEVRNFRLSPVPGVSDHLAISAELYPR